MSSLEQRLSIIQDIVGAGHEHKKRPVADPDARKVKRRRIIAELPINLTHVVQRVVAVANNDKVKKDDADKGETKDGDKNVHDDGDTEKKQNEQEIVADTIVQKYALYIKEQTKSLQDDIEAIERRRLATIAKQSKVYKTYIYGLSTIAQLSDLRDAPDALMPSNFGLLL